MTDIDVSSRIAEMPAIGRKFRRVVMPAALEARGGVSSKLVRRM